jgi:[acyl-carrier-protein] S-malonyltransferase
MNVKTAWMFPGQGAQYCGMGRGLAFDDPAVAAVFREAEALSEEPLREICVEGSAAALRDPAVLEPLLAVFSIVYTERLFARGLRPAAVAGYSAGAIAAMYCAGILDRRAALAIAAERGRILAHAKKECSGAMSIAYGLPALRLVQLIGEHHGRAPAIAGWNAPDHITVVGRGEEIADVVESVRVGGGQTLPVDVVGAWHCSIAEPLAIDIAAMLARFRFESPKIPYYCSVSGDRERDPLRLRDLLARQIHMPVLWQATVSNLVARERIESFVEVGCGKTLRGMTSRIFYARHQRIDFINLHDLMEYEYAA